MTIHKRPIHRGTGASKSVARPLLILVVLLVSAPLAFGQTAPSRLRNVLILSTGGTIAGRGASPTDLSNYKSGSVSGADLVDAVPQVRDIANVQVEQIVNVSSSDITIDDWLTIANRVNAAFASDPALAGVVVTHGTNTLEETAYFLNLTIKSDRPVILVGAMRPSTAISADGPLNLLNAVRTAASPESKGKGVLVVLNDEINAARDVTKTNTYRVETFRSPELGLLGYVDEDKVTFYRSSTRRHTASTEFDVSRMQRLPKVEILSSYVGADPETIRAVVNNGAKGVVFAGTGAGSLSTPERAVVKILQELPAGVRPVMVRSSRVGNGRVIANAQNDALGLIPADTLNPAKARILLMLALTVTNDPQQIRRMFNEY